MTGEGRDRPEAQDSLPLFLVAAVLVPLAFGLIDFMIPPDLSLPVILSPLLAMGTTLAIVRSRGVSGPRQTTLMLVTLLTMVLVVSIAISAHPMFQVYDQTK